MSDEVKNAVCDEIELELKKAKQELFSEISSYFDKNKDIDHAQSTYYAGQLRGYNHCLDIVNKARLR